MSEKSIKIAHLYSNDMNIYGDNGNIIAIKHRAKKYGFNVEIVKYNPGDKWPEDVDIYIGGGGQDNGQIKIIEDLKKHKNRIKDYVESGLAMLMVCGMYQLFGNYFVTSQGESIAGIGVLDMRTVAGDKRLIGNIITESERFGTLIGFENHGGKTFINQNSNIKPLAKVSRGNGNNGEDSTEGAILANVIGTYLHGSLLPKNPLITDFLISTASKNRYGEFNNQEVFDEYVDLARKSAVRRPY